MPARPRNISAEVDLSHTRVQVIDYYWKKQEQIQERQDLVVIRYRPFPAEVSLAARLPGGQVRDFGRLMFFPAQVEINTTPAEKDELTRNVVCSFSRTKFEEIWPAQWDWNEKLAGCLDLHNSRLEQAMQRIGMEAESPGFGSHLMVDALAQLIALEIARHFNGRQRPRRVRTSYGRLSTSELGRIYDYVDSRPNRSPTSAEISKECGVSSAHLRRSFKQTTGITLHDYVARSRLTKAQSLLLETDLPLKEIAYRLGFASCSTFSSTFRRESGETPSGYRQRALS